MLQQGRRSDPYPHTWEIPVGIAAATVLLAVLGVQVGRGLANWSAGRGWTWPTGKSLFSSLPGVLAGNAGAGLTSSGEWASPTLLTVWLVIVELLIAAALVAAITWGMRRWGPQRMKGMASAEQAETTLGLTRLRKVRRIIRPDLYGPDHTPTQQHGGYDGYHPTA